FSTSIWLARKGSMLTAWSTLTVDTSPADRPSLSTWTRAPSMPRMIGRPTPAPKNEDWTPGRRATVSPTEFAFASSRPAPATPATGLRRSSAVRAVALARPLSVARSVTPCSWPASSGTASWADAGTARASRIALASVARLVNAVGRGRVRETRRLVVMGAGVVMSIEMLYCFNSDATPTNVMATSCNLNRADRVGFAASSLCALLCALLPLGLAVLPTFGLSVGGWVDIDQAVTVFATLLGATTLAIGFR